MQVRASDDLTIVRQKSRPIKMKIQFQLNNEQPSLKALHFLQVSNQLFYHEKIFLKKNNQSIFLQIYNLTILCENIST